MPGVKSHVRDDASDTSRWQLAMAPPITQSKNGLEERGARPTTVAGRSISPSQPRPVVNQSVLTLEVMAGNQPPHTTTGAPPALAMIGRRDVISGYARTASNYASDSENPIAKQMNAVRNIMNARNAIIYTDANRAIDTCANRQMAEIARLPSRPRARPKLHTEKSASLRFPRFPAFSQESDSGESGGHFQTAQVQITAGERTT